MIMKMMRKDDDDEEAEDDGMMGRCKGEGER